PSVACPTRLEMRMNRMAGSVVFAVFAMISFPGIASAQAADPVTIWDGVYTEAQAVRGQELVQKNCSACHTASEWSNTAFIINWSGRPVHELQEFLASSMPLDAPGKLSEEEYVDI